MTRAHMDAARVSYTRALRALVHLPPTASAHTRAEVKARVHDAARVLRLALVARPRG